MRPIHGEKITKQIFDAELKTHIGATNKFEETYLQKTRSVQTQKRPSFAFYTKETHPHAKYTYSHTKDTYSHTNSIFQIPYSKRGGGRQMRP